MNCKNFKKEGETKMRRLAKMISIVAACVIIATVTLSGGTPISSVNEVNGYEVSPCSCDAAGNIGLRNPATVYCKEMGYEYKIVQSEDGERGICVLPDGNECDAWAFYRGECGEEFSYCAQQGWPVAKKAEGDSFATNCTTCILPDESRKTEIGRASCRERV